MSIKKKCIYTVHTEGEREWCGVGRKRRRDAVDAELGSA